jgi:hypothetical protein
VTLGDAVVMQSDGTSIGGCTSKAAVSVVLSVAEMLLAKRFPVLLH